MNATEALLITNIVQTLVSGGTTFALVYWLISLYREQITSRNSGVGSIPPGNSTGNVQSIPAIIPPPAPALKPREVNIKSTSWAGANDSQSSRTSAYDGHIIDGDNDLGAALPFRFSGTVPTIRVFANNKSVDVPIVDVGPWFDGRTGWAVDPYWQTGSRPRAETDTRTNGAGIDLTPAVYEALGFSGNLDLISSHVDWDFVSYLDATQPATLPATTTSAPSSSAVIGTDPPWLIKARSFSGLTWNSGPMPSSMKTWMQQIATVFPEMAAEANMLAGMNYWEWCGGFVQSMLAYSNIRGPFGATDTDKWPWAFSWATWGTDAMSNPQPGDVCVFKWASGGGHVCFYDHEEDDNYYHCTGGDQGTSLQVSLEAMPMSNCIAIRRPPTA
jgi:hypothetical protein